MSHFLITSTNIKGLVRIDRLRLGDHRGFLSRIFCSEELASVGWVKPIAQINHTYTAKRGTARGLHFQYPPYSEMKLVNCLRGAIWDVAVDLRTGSDTFLQWHAEELSADNGRSLLIPEGFAHGFQALTDDVELLYCHSEHYYPEAEGGLNPRDAQLAIDWPLNIIELSERDGQHLMLDQYFTGLVL